MAIATKPKSKKPAHVKKRQAQHHHQSKHYLKHYWPYIPALLIIGMGILSNSLLSTGLVLGAKSDFSTNTLLSRTNEARAHQQEQPLTVDQQLSSAAQSKAEDMAKHNYWAHNSPQGKTPWSFITTSGYQYQAAGENLAYGFDNANQVIAGWMNSAEHRANILQANYQNVGFGIAQAPNYLGKGPQLIVVAEYGQPVAAVADITFTVPEPAKVADVKGATDTAARPVSRIQLWTNGQASWSTLAIAALAGAAFALFVVRHGIRIRRVIMRGEYFVVQHPMLDLVIVVVCTVGFVLTRAGGFIR